jgi:DNA replication protein DnaC
LIGDSGTGKSHLLIGLGSAAAMSGFRGELVEAADEKQLTKTIARYGRADLLCIDELGYLELDRRGAEMLFQVLTEREEKNSVAIASNESFGGWTKTFTDPRLCAAIVDRLTFNRHHHQDRHRVLPPRPDQGQAAADEEVAPRPAGRWNLIAAASGLAVQGLNQPCFRT